MSAAIYNEIDPFAVRWLRNLITAGHVAHGAVDDRSISDLVPADIAGAGQRHFFAGIAGWSLALRLAGVPDDANVWTGSCPCQGLSSAGKRLGFNDPRHLWPAWFCLIRQCRPAVVFGEQVASALGWAWLDLVFADLEGAGYACAAADLPACSIGAPHRRQRIFFVAYADGKSGRLLAAQREPRRADSQTERSGEVVSLADATSKRRNGVPRDPGTWTEQPVILGRSETDRMAYTESGGRCERWDPRREDGTGPVDDCASVTLADPEGAGRRPGRVGLAHGRSSVQPMRYSDDSWTPCDWIQCSDGVSRPVEPGTSPLVVRLPGRVGLLRGYGNAFAPEVGATFIRAALEST